MVDDGDAGGNWAQIGWWEAANGVRKTFIQVHEPGIYNYSKTITEDIQDGQAAEPIDALTYYTVNYYPASGGGTAWFGFSVNTPSTGHHYTSSFTIQANFVPTESMIAGETTSTANQMAGDSQHPMTMADSSYILAGGSTWSPFNSPPTGTTAPLQDGGADYGVSTASDFGGGTASAWDWFCQPPHKVAAAMKADGSGGYELDQFGGLWPINSSPTVTSGAYWGGWNIARSIVLNPCDSSGNSGYVLDGYGGIHPFGGAPGVTASAYWSGFDIAKKIVVNPCNSGGVQLSGYVLDGYGGLHWFSNGAAIANPNTAYWNGWNIARDVAITGFGSGYTLDGYGGIHPFGSAANLSPAPAYFGWDIARAITMLPSGAGGYTLDGWGGVHQFGSAPVESYSGYWSGSDIANAIVSLSGGTSGYVMEVCGGFHQYGGAGPITTTGYYC
jgi:hypothetical protein